MLKRVLLQFLGGLQSQQFQPLFLIQSRPAGFLRSFLLAVRPDIGYDTRVAKSMHTEHGTFSRKELVLLVAPGGQTSIGMVQFFLGAFTLRAPVEVLFVCCSSYTKVSSNSWAPSGELMIVEATCLRNALPFVLAPSGAVQPIFPSIPGLAV